MLFHTFEFLLFFVLVYAALQVVRFPVQNAVLLIASYVFYACWDWRFLFLIMFSTAVDYVCALKMNERDESRKLYVWISVVVNLGLLCVFKYFNFFYDNVIAIASSIHLSLPEPLLRIVLPVGISFYTFQSMSYTIDVYRRTIKPTANVIDFALYVSFFPQLVAGPIERAQQLLTQIQNPRRVTLEQFYSGCYLFFWGLFEKVCVAYSCAQLVDPVFANSSNGVYSGGEVLVALYAFSFQILCDFDGYTNMARGVARCLGFELMLNFNAPYFASNPRDFWHRWHISLTTWLRDYVYIPLGGNRRGERVMLRNIAIVLVLGGLWHGAQWTFIAWGVYHACVLIVYSKLKAMKSCAWLFRLPKLVNVLICFHAVVFGWLLFRSSSILQAFELLRVLVDGQTDFYSGCAVKLKNLSFVLLPFLCIQFWQNRCQDQLAVRRLHWFVRTVVYALMMYAIISTGLLNPQEFMYFQF